MVDETASFSENVQMYLVTILRHLQEGTPVPLPDVARDLSISTAAVNEMSRKLQDQGLLEYRPYAGVSLTEKGQRLARLILRKHRLWEVFLVDTLHYDYQTAHETACMLEHATPPHLADRLETYLKNPLVNPQGDPIPQVGENAEISDDMALSLLSPGEEAVIIHWDGEVALNSFLENNQVRPGGTLKVLASGKENVLVQVGGNRTVIAREVAEEIQVAPLMEENEED